MWTNVAQQADAVAVALKEWSSLAPGLQFPHRLKLGTGLGAPCKALPRHPSHIPFAYILKAKNGLPIESIKGIQA